MQYRTYPDGFRRPDLQFRHGLHIAQREDSEGIHHAESGRMLFVGRWSI